MAPPTTVARSYTQKGAWRPTKMMNMEDLSRDDDFLSHLLVEKLGTGDVPLVVHKMDPSRRLPKTNAEDLLQIVRRMISARGSKSAIWQAVEELLRLNSVKWYLKSLNYDQKQVNAFATHASRYFELYLPGGSIEIAHTSRYTHRTGKSELCILATRPLHPGMVISELKGSMADLTDEEDKELKRTDGRHADGVAIRRDFSVIHSKQMKKNHLFLGPARFVNHDCDHNVELFREGRYITFRVIKMIGVGEEVTAHYGDGYFGENNCHCLCATCEKNGRGGYGPQDLADDVSDSGTGSAQGAPSDAEESETEDETPAVNVDHERRTRSGVYAVLPNQRVRGPMELLELGLDEEHSARSSLPRDFTFPEPSRLPQSSSDVTSLPPSSPHSAKHHSHVKSHGLPTPEPETEPRGRGMAKGNGRVGSAHSSSTSPGETARSRSSTAVPFKSVISTRAQKAREASMGASTSANIMNSAPSTRSMSGVRQLVTPPLTSDSTAPSAANSVRSSSRIRSRPVASGATSASRLSTPVPDRKGKGRATESISDAREIDKDEPEVRHLRPRAPVPVYDQHGISAKKPLDAPRGVDGKPLPLCITCANIIPVISVDSKIVWGLALGRTGKRGRPKKNLQVECPRCIRHYNIYARKWPERISDDGTISFIPLPCSTISSTPYVPEPAPNDGKSANPVGRPPKRPLEGELGATRGHKKQKVTGRPRGRPPKHKVGMSEQAKKILKVDDSLDGRRSGRARVPSLKLRESESPLKLRSSPRKNPLPDSPLTAEPESPTQILGSPLSKASSVPSSSPKSLAVAAQPRETNGRFGKKESTNGRFSRPNSTNRRYMSGHPMRPRRLSSASDHEYYEDDFECGHHDDSGDFEFTPSLSTPSGRVEIGEEALEDMVLKRPHGSDVDPYSPKRIRIEEDSGESDISPQSSPRFLMGRGSLLRPNPISFARRKWAVTTDEDEDLPPYTFRNMGHAGEDSEDTFSSPSDVTTPDSDDVPPPIFGSKGETASLMPAAQIVESVQAARLTMRPSPFNLARRRWAPLPSRLAGDVKVSSAIEQEHTGLSCALRKVSVHSSDESIRLTNSTLEKEEAGWYSDSHGSEDEYYDEYSDSDSWSEDEEYLMADSIAFRRAMSMDTGADSADDSEKIVERMLDARPNTTDSTLPAISREPSTPPRAHPLRTLDTLGYPLWKPPSVDASRRKSTLFFAAVSTSPKTLIQAGWDTASSDIES